jgi:hypothetical protein
MPRANKEAGDEKLARLFEDYQGKLISPGGAAQLLGLSRQTVYTLCKNGELNAYRSDELANKTTPRWVYIPLADVYAYAAKVGRVIPGAGDWVATTDSS